MGGAGMHSGKRPGNSGESSGFKPNLGRPGPRVETWIDERRS
jgi:hypothetical protein